MLKQVYPREVSAATRFVITDRLFALLYGVGERMDIGPASLETLCRTCLPNYEDRFKRRQSEERKREKERETSTALTAPWNGGRVHLLRD